MNSDDVIQLIFCVESTEKAATDKWYINEVLKNYFNVKENKVSYIFMGGKHNYNNQLTIKKIILITETTNKLGKQLSYLLSKNNRLILLGKNESLLKGLKEELIKQYNNPFIDYVVCDYINTESVYRAVDTIKSKYHFIDVIIHNAGALLKPKGNKVHPALRVNFISPLLLNELLLDLLLKSSSPTLFYTSTMATPKSVSFDILDNMKDASRIKSYEL